MEIIIRPAYAHDAAAIAAIYAEHVRTGTASFETVAPNAAFMADKVAAFGERGWPFLVLETGGQMMGYAYAGQFRDRAAYSASCEDSIYIRSDVRGQGIGSKLLNALIAESTAFGFRQMIAVIGGGEPASIALHKKMGFVRAGRMQSIGRKFGRWLDTVYMQLALGPGDSQPPDNEPV